MSQGRLRCHRGGCASSSSLPPGGRVSALPSAVRASLAQADLRAGVQAGGRARRWLQLSWEQALQGQDSVGKGGRGSRVGYLLMSLGSAPSRAGWLLTSPWGSW